MADEEYEKKYQSLQQYVPFLENMISQLKDPARKNREQQVSKMESLYSMITDKRKKLKLETLDKCEDVILKLYKKVNSSQQNSFNSGPTKLDNVPPFNFTTIDVKRPTQSSRDPRVSRISPITTPASPSPTREIPVSKPVVIPTEKVKEKSSVPSSNLITTKCSKVDIYSSAAESLNKKPESSPKESVFNRLGYSYKPPDMSKPPISIADLESLQNDEPPLTFKDIDTDKLSALELNDLRHRIKKQLDATDHTTYNKNELNINTTVRNSTIPVKKPVTVPIEKNKPTTDVNKHKSGLSKSSEKKSLDNKHNKESSSSVKENTKSTHESIISRSNSSDSVSSKASKDSSNKAKSPMKSPRVEKIIPAADSIFGNLLSSIDSHLLEIKKTKEKRLSTSSKDDSESSKKVADKKDRDKGESHEKHSKHKKKSHKKDKHRDKSSDKHKQRKKDKIKSDKKEAKSEESSEKLKENEHKKADKTKSTSEKGKINTESSSEKSIQPEHLNTKPVEDVCNIAKLKEKAIDLKKKLQEKPTEEKTENGTPNNDKNDGKPNLKEPTFKRLADKYNPKPRKLSNASEIDEVADSIEKTMKKNDSVAPIPFIDDSKLTPPPLSFLSGKPTVLPSTQPIPPQPVSPQPVPPPSVFIPPDKADIPLNISSIITNPNTSAIIDDVVNSLKTHNSQLEKPHHHIANPNEMNAPYRFNPQTQQVGFNNQDLPPQTVNFPMRSPDFVPPHSFVKEQNLYPGNNSNFQKPPLLPTPNLPNRHFNGPNFEPTVNKSFNPFEGAIESQHNRSKPLLELPVEPANNHPFKPYGEFQQDSDLRFERPVDVNLQVNRPMTPFDRSVNPRFDMHQNRPNTPFDRPEHVLPRSATPFFEPPNRQFNNEEVPMYQNKFNSFAGPANQNPFQDGGYHGKKNWPQQDLAYQFNLGPGKREDVDMRQGWRETPRDPRMTRDPRNSRDPRSRDQEKPSWDRDRYCDRESRPRYRDNRANRYERSRSKESQHKNSRSTSKPRESFVSPLDSLYNPTDTSAVKTGRGYGVQQFRIKKEKSTTDVSKKQEEDDDKEVEKILQPSTSPNEVDKKPEGQKEDTSADDNAVIEEKDKDADKTYEPKAVVEEDKTERETKPSEKEVEAEPTKPKSKKDTSEQGILAQFFTSLMNSSDKKDKKVALLSLITTFSDSFSEQQMKRIESILKSDEGDENSDDETSNDKEQDKHKTEDESKKSEETATKQTEEEEPDKSKEEEEFKKPISPPQKKLKKQQTKATKKTEIDSKESTTEEEEEDDEDDDADNSVTVSVGERIKSQKRKSVDQKKIKKAHRTELDMLHEDIQGMFIRDGVLTANGKRVCRMLKENPEALTPLSNTDEETQKKKPISNIDKEKVAALKTKVTVVLPKIAINEISTGEDNKSRYSLRRPKPVVVEETTDYSLRKPKKLNYGEESDSHETSREESSDTEHDETVSDEEEEEEIGETSDKGKSIKKAPSKKRKLRSCWATGVIKKTKRKKVPSFSKDDIDKDSNNKDLEDPLEVVEIEKPKKAPKKGETHQQTRKSESDSDVSYIEPDLNYYWGSKDCTKCKICSIKQRFLTAHYKTDHPDNEVLISRLSPERAKEAIRISKELKYDSFEEKIKKTRGSKLNYCCIFCNYILKNSTPTPFYDHLTLHTGEYRFNCEHCAFTTWNTSALSKHHHSEHATLSKNMDRFRVKESPLRLFGYICTECNYLQISKAAVLNHIKIYHLGNENEKICKINLSTFNEEESKYQTEEQSTNVIAENKEESDGEEVHLPDSTMDFEDSSDSINIQKEDKPNSKKRISSIDEEPTSRKVRKIQEDVSSSDEKINTDREELVIEKRASESRQEKLQKEREERLRLEKEKEELLKQQRLEKIQKQREARLKKQEEEKLRKQKEEEERLKTEEEELLRKEEEARLENERIEKERMRKENEKKAMELNVFTCNTDQTQEEEKIEAERLKKMEELNKSVKISRNLSVDFIEKLTNKLTNQKEDLEKPLIKGEPLDELTETIEDEPVEVFEKSKVLLSCENREIDDKNKLLLNKDIQQNKNKFIDSMVQKLQGKLRSASSDSVVDNNVIPPLTHVKELQMTNSSKHTILDTGLIKLIKSEDSVLYSCLVPPCVFTSQEQESFAQHCKEAHKWLSYTCSKCEACGKKITSHKVIPLLTDLLDHINKGHAEFLTFDKKPIAIKMRRFSGDTLSNFSKNEDNLIVAEPESNTENKSMQEQVMDADDLPVSMGELIDCSEIEESDNPFGFKISAVTSLAEPQTNNPPELVPLSKTKNDTPKSNILQTKIVELKMCEQEISKKKDPISIKKFVRCSQDLYKCSYYNCTFSTKIRDMYDRHIAVHNYNPNTHVPCVYCHFKTPVGLSSLHMYIRHANSTFMCQICLYRAVKKSFIVYHIKTEHKLNLSKVLPIVQVPPTPPDPGLKIELPKPNLRQIIEPFSCNCGQEFIFEEEFKNHLKLCEKMFQCQFCTRSSCLSPVSYFMHLKQKHNYNTYQCGYCQFSNNNSNQMVAHHVSVHPHLNELIYSRKHPIKEGHYFKNIKAYSQLITMTIMEDGSLVKNDSNNAAVTPEKLTEKSPDKILVAPPKIINFNLSSYLSASCTSKAESGTEEKTDREFIILSNEPQNMDQNTIPDLRDPLEISSSDHESDKQLETLDQTTNKGSEVNIVNVRKICGRSTSISGEDSDSKDTDNDDQAMKKSGLVGTNLYKCAICFRSFINASMYKDHIVSSNGCKSTTIAMKPFMCAHCGRFFRNATGLLYHISYHGLLRFKCSLCNEQFAHNLQCRNHMKTRHKITSTINVPLIPCKNDLDEDVFIVKPKSATVAAVEESSAAESTNISSTLRGCKKSFKPSEINTIPIRSVFPYEISCGLCEYKTKVRTNLVRHLQFHSNEREVPATAPVNPVPCLEKNEKMFDKMTNLAFNSFSTGASRMGGQKTESKEKTTENEDLPGYIPTHRRFVCGADCCNYLCPEESNLRHHLEALHTEETTFTCAHCKRVLTDTDADGILKHLKLHDLNLHRCSVCPFIHNLRHKVEQHLKDKHSLDSAAKIVTVRSFDNPPPVEEQRTEEVIDISDSFNTSNPKWVKPWRCGMCKYKCAARDDILGHILNKHDIDSQYKCTLCTFKSNDNSVFVQHFNEEHPGQTKDIIMVYQYSGEDKTSAEIDFDTTPLWRRDKPRVRHIRGILFDETSVSHKNAKKTPTKNTTNTPTTSSTSTTPNPSNLDSAIDAVAKGTADVMKKLNFTTVSDEIFDKINKSINKVDIATVIDICHSDDEDVVIVDNPTSEVIDVETFPHYDDTDEGPEQFTKDDLIREYGPLGTSHLSQFSCPKCNNFRTKKVQDFIHHMFRDLFYKRFRCKVCNQKAVTRKFLRSHIKNHVPPVEESDGIKVQKSRRDIEMWIQMVVRSQAKSIVQQHQKPEPITSINEAHGTCQFCSDFFQNLMELHIHEVSHWMRNSLQCNFCDFNCDLKADMFAHYNTVHAANAEEFDFKSSFKKDMAPTVSRYVDMCDGLDVIKLEKDESSPMLVSAIIEEPTSSASTSIIKSEQNKSPTSSKVYCSYCYEEGNSVTYIKTHWLKEHKDEGVSFKFKRNKNVDNILACKYCNFKGTEGIQKRHYLNKHQELPISIYRFLCPICKTGCKRIDEYKQHLKKAHRTTNTDYLNIFGELCKLKDSAELECCICQHKSPTIPAMKNHVRLHCRMYRCGFCKTTFRCKSDATAHFSKDHPHHPENIEILQDKVKEYDDICSKIINAKHGKHDVLEEETDVPKKKVTVKNYARKSTGAPFVSPDEFSYYGSQPDSTNLKQVRTEVQVQNSKITMTVDQLSNIFNLFPEVPVLDCQNSEQAAEEPEIEIIDP